ncbi:MAG: LanC-like protein [Casimicrobiaceae bacterium]
MLFDPRRHEALLPLAWDEARVRTAIAAIVADCEAHYSPKTWWPLHALDREPGDDPHLPSTTLYYGACGVIWALHFLQAIGAARLSRDYLHDLETLVQSHRETRAAMGSRTDGSYLMGEVPILMLAFGEHPTAASADRLAALIADNMTNPARELMWGSPGTLLAAQFLHDRTGDARWVKLFRDTADQLWSELEWSSDFGCHTWPQDLYGRRSNYLGAVHGFVATALPLIRGRALLGAQSWAAWAQCIATTVARTATREGPLVNWRPELDEAHDPPKILLQHCHGAPGFVTCLAGFPGTALDPLLLAAGETIWAAGPLTKGSNLCHGTGGNGYALLELHQRTRDPKWLDRARAFAMHGIVQTETAARQFGHMRHSLWTGDPGFAIYLWDCLNGIARFPTLDVYYGR